MALLQISEPGQAPDPHKRRLAAGIDLGTTNSLIATVRSGQSEVLADDTGEPILPSVVHYGEHGLTVGAAAKREAVSDPQNTLISVKRFLGRSLDEVTQRYPNSPYAFAASESGTVSISTRRGVVHPVQTSAAILETLAKRAEASLHGELEGVVITVPAYFDDAQRQATKDAAEMAGLHVLRLLNEPTAASIAYGLDQKQEGLIAVYDLGGGTFDISILRLSRGVFEVLATGGDSQLGGDDFDEALAAWLAQQAGLSAAQYRDNHRHLLLQACEIKQQLSEQEDVQVTLSIAGAPLWQGEVTRAQFEAQIAALVKQTLRVCKRALRDAGISAAEIDEVVMVGGSTRVPYVRQQVGSAFGCEPLTRLNPDEVVALGAAIQADVLVGNRSGDDLLLLDVIPLSLGLETMGGLTEKVIPRNTTIPVARAQEFTTFKDGQTAMAIHVVQGEREMVGDCRSLARFELRDIPPMAAGTAVIRVTFQVDADGLLSVTAMEKTTARKASIQVKPSYGLSDAEITTMLKDSMTHARDDMQQRMVIEQRIDAIRNIEAVEAALAADGELIDAQERQSIEAAIAKLKVLAEGEDGDAIKAANKALDEISTHFAAVRMDQSMRKALTGQSVDKVE